MFRNTPRRNFDTDSICTKPEVPVICCCLQVLMGSFTGSTDVKEALKTKGGDPVAAVPEFKLPAQWDATVPYPKYAEDWYKPFLVDAE